jgi:hypothetical protein
MRPETFDACKMRRDLSHYRDRPNAINLPPGEGSILR